MPSPAIRRETANDTGPRGGDLVRADESRVPAESRTGPWPTASVGRSFDRVRQVTRRLSPTLLSLILVVVLPILGAAIYTLAWASPRYVSEFRVAVRTVEATKSFGLPEIFGIGGLSQSGNDANAVVQFLHSRDAVESIEKRFPLRRTFSDGAVDLFSRMHGKGEIEALTRYWNKMIDAFYEASTGTIVVRITAFTPQDALAVAKLALQDSETLVNRMSSRVREDSVAFAEGEVAKAEKRLLENSRKLQELQDRESILDPLKTAQTNIELATKLKEQIVQRSAELASIRRYLAPDAPSVRALEEAITALRTELARLEAQATAARGSQPGPKPKTEAERPLSSVFGAFQQMADERTFAEKAYISALASLEAARMEAGRQQVYLSVIVPPGLPEEADFPRPLRQIGLTALISIAVWLIGLLGVYSVREHM